MVDEFCDLQQFVSSQNLPFDFHKSYQVVEKVQVLDPVQAASRFEDYVGCVAWNYKVGKFGEPFFRVLVVRSNGKSMKHTRVMWRDPQVFCAMGNPVVNA